MSAFIAAELRAAVIERARRRCEYCGIPEAAVLFAHEVDHIIAEQHQGKTTLGNLALACFHCNRNKGPNIATLDGQTGEIVRLFNPRADHWDEHFRRIDAQIVPMTALGRGTATLLGFNTAQRVRARHMLMRSGWWSA